MGIAWKRVGREHTAAVVLTTLLLSVLWFGGRVTHLKRTSLEIRTLPIQEGFEVAANPDVDQSATKALPDAPVLRRRSINLQRETKTSNTLPIQERLQIGRRMELSEQAIERSPLSKATSTRRSTALITRKADDSRGVKLEAIGSTGDEPITPERNVPAVNAPSVSARTNDGQIELPQKRLPEFTQPIETDAIVAWMRLSESDLPPGIKRHVEYQPGNLTAVAELNHAGETWELYLLARMPLRELHVVIVRNDASWYLIDRSFAREGRSFRMGYVRRKDGVITGVVSEERPAASQEAVDFYRIFLAWWDQERLKL